MCKAQFGRGIKKIKCDGGGEFINNDLKEWYAQEGIIMQQSMPYTHEQVGAIEREHRTLHSKARAMMTYAKLPKGYWGYALKAASYLKNRCVITRTGKTPYEVWYGSKPDVSKIRIFGCDCIALVPKERRRPGDDHGIKCTLVGYFDNGYLLVKRGQSRDQVKSKDVRFNESWIENDHSVVEDSTSGSESESFTDNKTENMPRRSARIAELPKMSYKGMISLADVHEVPVCNMTYEDREPKSVAEAFSGEDGEKWRE